MKKVLLTIFVILYLNASFAQQNQPLPLPKINVELGTAKNPEDISTSLQLLLALTILAIAPSIILMTTCYLRVIIVFHFLRTALGTQQMPPNQLLAGAALFIMFFVMAPAWQKAHDEGLKPYIDKKITLDSAYSKGIAPIREFMFKNVRQKDLELFLSIANMPQPDNRDDIPIHILIPAYTLSELRAGFIIGFFLFVPFLMIDMIVASILMSMGMMMLPPMLISTPFKILLFVLIDGWNLIVGSLVRSINL